MVLDDADGLGGGSVGVKGMKERYWTKFLKGMVTDRNTGPYYSSAYSHAVNLRSEL
jgi:hypothetical protein